MCLNPVGSVAVGLEAAGLGIFGSSTLGALEVGERVVVFQFPWNGSSPI